MCWFQLDVLFAKNAIRFEPNKYPVLKIIPQKWKCKYTFNLPLKSMLQIFTLLKNSSKKYGLPTSEMNCGKFILHYLHLLHALSGADWVLCRCRSTSQTRAGGCWLLKCCFFAQVKYGPRIRCEPVRNAQTSLQYTNKAVALCGCVTWGRKQICTFA